MGTKLVGKSCKTSQLGREAKPLGTQHAVLGCAWHVSNWLCVGTLNPTLCPHGGDINDLGSPGLRGVKPSDLWMW